MKILLTILAFVLVVLIIVSFAITLNTAYMAGERKGIIAPYFGWIGMIVGSVILSEVIDRLKTAFTRRKPTK